MFNLLEGHKNSLEVNSVLYSNLNEAVQDFKSSRKQLTIVLNKCVKIKDN